LVEMRNKMMGSRIAILYHVSDFKL
jgi:hypothetical protein